MLSLELGQRIALKVFKEAQSIILQQANGARVKTFQEFAIKEAAKPMFIYS